MILNKHTCTSSYSQPNTRKPLIDRMKLWFLALLGLPTTPIHSILLRERMGALRKWQVSNLCLLYSCLQALEKVDHFDLSDAQEMLYQTFRVWEKYNGSFYRNEHTWNKEEKCLLWSQVGWAYNLMPRYS